MVFPQSRQMTVWTCSWHSRWSLWPTMLHIELADATEDLTMPAVAPLTALDDMLHMRPVKATWRVPEWRA